MRPAVFQVGGTLYWVILTRDPDTMVLKDADSTPTVAVRKNGVSVGDSVTVTKRDATTGIYDCSYNPAAEVEGDAFTLEESATVTGTTTSSATYTQTWNARVVAVERGTDSAALAATALSTAVWTATIAGRIDVAVSTRLAPMVAGRDLSVAATTGTVELDSATQAVLADIPTNAELTAALSGLATQSYIDSVLSTYVIEAF